MTAGAMVLMALGNNPPSASAFCLNRYYQLGPVEEAVSTRTAQYPSRWNRIEVFRSGTEAGNFEQLADLPVPSVSDDIDSHFCIFNGLGGDDGRIQSTEKWQKQWSVMPKQNRADSDRTIRICIIADGKTAGPTELQVRRLQELLEELCRRFEIRPQYISYPRNWQRR
jgi:hypothetical protein